MNISSVNNIPKVGMQMKKGAMITAGAGAALMVKSSLNGDKPSSEALSNYGKAMINLHKAPKKFNEQEYLTNEYIAMMDAPKQESTEFAALEKFSAEEEIELMDSEVSKQPVEGLKDDAAKRLEHELLTNEHIMLMD